MPRLGGEWESAEQERYLVHGRQPRRRLPPAAVGVLAGRQRQLRQPLRPWGHILQGHACGPRVASWSGNKVRMAQAASSTRVLGTPSLTLVLASQLASRWGLCQGSGCLVADPELTGPARARVKHLAAHG